MTVLLLAMAIGGSLGYRRRVIMADTMSSDRSARARELLSRKADITLPSAEGSLGIPQDLLEMTAEELRALLDSAASDERQGDEDPT